MFAAGDPITRISGVLVLDVKVEQASRLNLSCKASGETFADMLAAPE